MELIKNLAAEFKEIERIHKIPPGDFPNVKEMQQLLLSYDFSYFESRNDKLFESMNQVMSIDLPKLMKTLAPVKMQQDTNPFASSNWVVTEGMQQGFNNIFTSLMPKNGKINGQAAMKPMQECGISVSDLRQIWELSDFEKDGTLDLDEFALAMYLCQRTKAGDEVPKQLPPSYIPPSKRHRFQNVDFKTGCS